jgi:hypothetical protein
MAYEEKKFETRPDSGRLMASTSKRSDKSPDYYGEIVIDPRNMTKVTVENGLHIYRINGWKKVAKSGKTYLSLSVDRYIKDEAGYQSQNPAPNNDFGDDDIPF